MPDKDNFTMEFDLDKEKEQKAKNIILSVYRALAEKGYNPTTHFIGYILSGAPTYITSHHNARSLIRQIERDELLEELLKTYLDKK